MADLAKVDSPLTARRRNSDNRDFVLPGRRQTDAPRLEVNAPLVGRSQSEAQRLSEILGLVEDVAQGAVGLLEQREARQRGEARTQGSLDEAAGSPNETQLANSRAYAQGYYASGAQRTVIEISKRAQEVVNARLFDEENPATLEDVNDALNELFASYALNEDGTPRNFGDPMAANIMANGLARIRSEILPTAVDYIRTRQNEKLASNVAFNLANGGLPEIFNPTATTPIGLRVPQPGDVVAVETPPSAFAPEVQAAREASSTGGLMAPFAGFQAATPSSRLGEPRDGGRRSHNGEDFPIPVGTPLVAPAAGRVVSTKSSKAGGKQVIIELANGDRIGFAHLSSINVKEGDRVRPGHPVALSGNTGQSSGPHVHMTVTVDGQKVSPSEYFEKAGDVAMAPPGANEDPNLADRLHRPAEVQVPVVDFEAVMAQRPPSISPGEWKAYMIPAIITNAEEAGRPELLDGLWRSKRADGTPSFNPKEIATIRDAADRIRDERRIASERARREKWEANSDLIVTEILNDRAPSDSTIIDLVNRGELDPVFGYSVIEQRENEREAEVREIRAEEREARILADREWDLEAATLQMEREAGILEEATHDADVRRLQRGEFGTGKAALRRFRQVRAATTQAIRRLEESPIGQHYATLLSEAFPKVSQGDGSMLSRVQGPQSNARRASALAHYSSLIAEGKHPRDAYAQTVKVYGSDNPAALRSRLEELRSRQ